jgi:hypothetical protein
MLALYMEPNSDEQISLVTLNAYEMMSSLELILNQEKKAYTLIRTSNNHKYGDPSKWVENYITMLNKINKKVYNFILGQGYKLKQKEGMLIFENPSMAKS